MIETTVHQGLGILTLNRPSALNALSLAMIRHMSTVLKAWASDPSLKAILIESALEKAFCVGGDVRAVYEAQKAGDVETCESFFREEYTLNALIYFYPKPYIAFIDGLAMGGGLGISVNGSHRIVTERALLAMPETGIGFFPDVGATTFLTHGKSHSVGLYLGLTGTPLKAKDALWFGLATHYVPSADLSALKTELEKNKDIEQILSRCTQAPEEKGFLEERQEVIEKHFSKASLKEILESLEKDPSSFAQNTLHTLKSTSPTSLAVTFRQLKKQNPPLSFAEGMKQEFRLSQRMIRSHDFREGIRAVLVDKDRLPHWKPLEIEDITEQEINAFFEPLGEKELMLDWAVKG